MVINNSVIFISDYHSLIGYNYLDFALFQTIFKSIILLLTSGLSLAFEKVLVNDTKFYFSVQRQISWKEVTLRVLIFDMFKIRVIIPVYAYFM